MLFYIKRDFFGNKVLGNGVDSGLYFFPIPGAVEFYFGAVGVHHFVSIGYCAEHACIYLRRRQLFILEIRLHKLLSGLRELCKRYDYVFGVCCLQRRC